MRNAVDHITYPIRVVSTAVGRMMVAAQCAVRNIVCWGIISLV